jgi:hypothetical protein
MDATLGELAECVRREVEAARKRDSVQLVFSFIYPDASGKFRRKEVGQVIQGQRDHDYK